MSRIQKLLSDIKNNIVKKIDQASAIVPLNILTIKEIESIADALKTNMSVTEINLPFSAIDDQKTKVLAAVLKVNANITKVNLSMNIMGNEAAVEIAKMLEENTSITDLNLAMNAINLEGVTALAIAIKRSRNLTIINLTGNPIGNAGAKILAKAFEVNKSIVKINLLHCKIGEEGLTEIDKAIEQNKSIIYFNTEETSNYDLSYRITDQLIKKYEKDKTFSLHKSFWEDFDKALFPVKYMLNKKNMLDLFDKATNFRESNNCNMRFDLNSQHLIAFGLAEREYGIANSFNNALSSYNYSNLPNNYMPSFPAPHGITSINSGLTDSSNFSLGQNNNWYFNRDVRQEARIVEEIFRIERRDTNIPVMPFRIVPGERAINTLFTPNRQGFANPYMPYGVRESFGNLPVPITMVLAYIDRKVNEIIDHIKDNIVEEITIPDHFEIKFQLHFTPNINLITAEQFERIIEAFKGNSSIRKINLTSNTNAVAIIVKILKDSKNLLEIILDDNNINLEEAKLLAEAFKKNISVRKVKLSNCNINDGVAIILAEAFKTQYSIRIIDLSNNQIGIKGIEALDTLIKDNKNILEINLPKNKDEIVTAKDSYKELEAMIEAIKNDPNIKIINLSNSTINNNWLIMIAEALHDNTNVKTLDLSHYRHISRKEFRALAKLIEHNNNIKVINLSICESIKSKDAKTLAKALKHNNTIQEINFSRCNIGIDGMEALAEVLEVKSNILSIGKYNILMKSPLSKKINELIDRNHRPAMNIVKYLIEYCDKNYKFPLNASFWKEFIENQASVEYIIEGRQRPGLYKKAIIFYSDNFFRIMALGKSNILKYIDNSLPALPYDIITHIIGTLIEEQGTAKTLETVPISKKNLNEGLIRAVENNDEKIFDSFFEKINSRGCRDKSEQYSEKLAKLNDEGNRFANKLIRQHIKDNLNSFELKRKK